MCITGWSANPPFPIPIPPYPTSQSCLKAWGGQDANIPAAQEALIVRSKANSEAARGVYGTLA